MAKNDPVKGLGAEEQAPEAPVLQKLAEFVKELEAAGERVAGMFAHYYGNVQVIEEAAHDEFVALFTKFKDTPIAELYPEIENIRQ